MINSTAAITQSENTDTNAAPTLVINNQLQAHSSTQQLTTLLELQSNAGLVHLQRQSTDLADMINYFEYNTLPVDNDAARRTVLDSDNRTYI